MSLENFLVFFLFLLILQPNFFIKRFLIKKKTCSQTAQDPHIIRKVPYLYIENALQNVITHDVFVLISILNNCTKIPQFWFLTYDCMGRDSRILFSHALLNNYKKETTDTRISILLYSAGYFLCKGYKEKSRLQYILIQLNLLKCLYSQSKEAETLVKRTFKSKERNLQFSSDFQNSLQSYLHK